MPTVSVIVPNYNHAQYLRKRVESILGQTYQDFELILLDDCSTDESREILTSYANDPRVRTEFNAQNSGSSFKQWNKGVRLAREKYVWIAESDDYADERFLEKLVARLEREPKSVLCYCRSWRVSGSGEVGGFWDGEGNNPDEGRWATDFVADGREEFRTYLAQRNTIPNASAVVFRREVYEGVGGADEKLRLCGDWKLWSAMALKGDIAYIAEPLNYFRCHEASVRMQSQRRPEAEAAECLEVIHSIAMQLVGANHAVPKALLDGYRHCMKMLEPSNPEGALRASVDFLRFSKNGEVNRWEIAETWLRAARIEYRLGRPGRALLSAGHGFLIRPMVAGRPLKSAFSRIAAALKS
jgi:Glycosyl transferase family 2